MAGTLDGITVAFLAADGVEQVEYAGPRGTSEGQGATVHLLSLGTDPVQAVSSDITPAGTLTPDRAVGTADVVRGRTLTSWPSLTTDIRNAGGHRVDEQVCVDGNLITSRNPDDVPAFSAKLVEVFAGARRHGTA